MRNIWFEDIARDAPSKCENKMLMPAQYNLLMFVKILHNFDYAANYNNSEEEEELLKWLDSLNVRSPLATQLKLEWLGIFKFNAGMLLF